MSLENFMNESNTYVHFKKQTDEVLASTSRDARPEPESKASSNGFTSDSESQQLGESNATGASSSDIDGPTASEQSDDVRKQSARTSIERAFEFALREGVTAAELEALIDDIYGLEKAQTPSPGHELARTVRPNE
eukprot:scaffold54270_cov18-Prasinocladus_malaysianus.AAC.1